jgi:hypothetical protein
MPLSIHTSVALRIAISITNHFSTDQKRIVTHRSHARLSARQLKAARTSITASKLERSASVGTVSSVFLTIALANAERRVPVTVPSCAVDLAECPFGKTRGLGYVSYILCNA